MHSPPHRWRTPAFSRFFALFLCLPFLSSDVPGTVPIRRACGAEGGQLGSSCPCPASVSRIPAPAGFCAEAKNSLPRLGKHGGCSIRAAWQGRRGKQAASEAALVAREERSPD